MGIPAWVWFLIAVLAIAAGVALLVADRSRRAPNNRERRRWAALRGWQFAEADQVLPSRWERGALAQHRGAAAADVVAGSTFTADGRRQVSVLDLVAGGKVATVLAGVRCRRKIGPTIELWQPDVPVPQDSDLDLLGPVGSRYAFVTEVAAARPLVTPQMVEAAEEVGPDVTVVWLEQDWVLAAIDPDAADPSRLERLLRSLGELADLVDPFESDPNADTAADESAPAEDLGEELDSEHEGLDSAGDGADRYGADRFDADRFDEDAIDEESLDAELLDDPEPTVRKGRAGATSPADTNETVRVRRESSDS